MFGLKVWSYSFIIRKKYEKISTECRDIRQNHLTIKLGHSDPGILYAQRSGHTHIYGERSMFIYQLSAEI